MRRRPLRGESDATILALDAHRIPFDRIGNVRYENRESLEDRSSTMVFKKIIHSLVFVAAWTILVSSASTTGLNSVPACPPADPQSANHLPDTIEKAAAQPARFSDIDELRLFQVIGGKRQKICLSGKELENGQGITCKGYVCGVELISPRGDLAAALGDHPLSIVARHTDGPTPGAGSASTGLYRYVYFPSVPGEAVSAKDRFSISIDGLKDRCQLQVQHSGYQTLARLPKTAPPAHGSQLIVRYLGTDMPAFESSLPDLRQRIEAIAHGTEKIEKAAGVKLVSYLDILQYEGMNNALNTRGQDRICIYASTLRHQPCRELRSMGEHETLHLLVDRQGYTAQTSIRRFFSDLHGFGPFSLERFSLVTQGGIAPQALPAAGQRNPFFAFINEGNFIPGMTGGHSGDNLDEFCVSFLHDLLYCDAFEKNVAKSVLIASDGEHLRLSPQDRQNIRRDFRNALDLFMASGASALVNPSVYRQFSSAKPMASMKCVSNPPCVEGTLCAIRLASSAAPSR
jgi:hypothetical protein